MSIDRTNPCYWWKTLRLGDQARFDQAEGYGVELGPGDWRPVGLEQNYRQLVTQGAQALYSHQAAILMARNGAIIAGAAELSETDEEFRKRLRAFLVAFATEARTRVDTNHAGALSLGYRAHEWTATAAVSAGTAVAISLTGSPDATDFAGFPVLILEASTQLHEVAVISSGGSGTITVAEVLYSYATAPQIIPLEWSTAAAWPDGALEFQKTISADEFTAGVRFRFSDEPLEVA